MKKTAKKKGNRNSGGRRRKSEGISKSQSMRIRAKFEALKKEVDHAKAESTARDATEKAKELLSSGSAQLRSMASQALLLAEMAYDALGGRFSVPWKTIIAITAVLLYFLSPIDIIPDFLPVVGYLDDAYLIYWACTSLIADDLRGYCGFRKLKPADFGLE